MTLNCLHENNDMVPKWTYLYLPFFSCSSGRFLLLFSLSLQIPRLSAHELFFKSKKLVRYVRE